MAPGEVKVFTKSGNNVLLVEISAPDEWVVERIDGASKGKHMVCRESGLTNVVDGLIHEQ